MELKHVPVLLNECIEGLNIKKNGIYVDGTLGGAGHSIEILKKLNEDGILIGIDRDEFALSMAKEKLKCFENVKFIHDNYNNLINILSNLNIAGVDGILLDLGISSFQIDDTKRGFSYINDSNLDMRMDKTQLLTAKDIVNMYDEVKLANIIYEYGEEKYSRRIARNICEYRKNKFIETTQELVEIIKKSVAKNTEDGHPAKRTFQAIRIEVNNELAPLKNTIFDAISVLNAKGRLCVITFHSLEDRIIKNAFIEAAGKCICPSDLPYCMCGAKTQGKIITKKPIVPSENEMKNNSRSQSAKLRIFEKI